jgi:hypothetical protein
MRVAGSRATQRGPIAWLFLANGRVSSAAGRPPLVAEHRRRVSRCGCGRVAGVPSEALSATWTEAGVMAKYPRRRGVGAEEFFRFEKVRAWCAR